MTKIIYYYYYQYNYSVSPIFNESMDLEFLESFVLLLITILYYGEILNP
jgi:hypothetical protein